jgi:arsenate reductase-like glutaredoxin family protein
MDDASPRLYTQDGCAESARVRAWLTERGVPFFERNASADAAAARELAATGIFATPMLVVGRRRVLGYRPETIQSALDAERTAE